MVDLFIKLVIGVLAQFLKPFKWFKKQINWVFVKFIKLFNDQS